MGATDPAGEAGIPLDREVWRCPEKKCTYVLWGPRQDFTSVVLGMMRTPPEELQAIGKAAFNHGRTEHPVRMKRAEAVGTGFGIAVLSAMAILVAFTLLGVILKGVSWAWGGLW